MSLKEWLDEAPHRGGCGATIALSDMACTCGKVDALRELDELTADEESAEELRNKIKEFARDI
jgi:hypothetical protein